MTWGRIKKGAIKTLGALARETETILWGFHGVSGIFPRGLMAGRRSCDTIKKSKIPSGLNGAGEGDIRLGNDLAATNLNKFV